MAKALWLIMVAACLCQVLASPVAGGHAAASHAEVNKSEGNHTGNKTKHGEKAEGKEEEESTSTASVILLGGIVFLVALYYMVNSHIKGVPKQTWSAISSAVSIFCAVMINNTINHLFKQESTGHGHHGTIKTVLIDGTQLVIMTLIVAVTLFLQRASKLRIYAYGVIGGHLLGFGAIDTFATVAGLPWFLDSYWKTLLVFVIYVVAIHILVLPLRYTFSIFGKCCSGDDQSKEELEEAEEQAKETAVDFFCMGGGFLLSMFARGLIKNKVVPEHPEDVRHTMKQVVALSAFGTAFLIFAGVFRYLQHNAKVAKKPSKQKVHILDLCGTLSSMTCAWCWLVSGDWYFLHHFPKDEMIANMAVALDSTIIFIVCVYLFSLAVKHVGPGVKQTLKGEFTAVGLMLGLAWEHVFDKALEGVKPFIDAQTGPDHPVKARLLMAGLTFALMVVVFPAWVAYIVPKGGEGMKNLNTADISPLTAFCDCEGGEEESSDEEAAE